MLVVRFLHKCIEGSRARTAPNTLSNAISDTNNEPVPDISDERSHRNSFAAAAPHPAGRARYQKALSEELGVRPRTNPLRLEWEALDFKIGKARLPPPPLPKHVTIAVACLLATTRSRSFTCRCAGTRAQGLARPCPAR